MAKAFSNASRLGILDFLVNPNLTPEDFKQAIYKTVKTGGKTGQTEQVLSGYRDTSPTGVFGDATEKMNKEQFYSPVYGGNHKAGKGMIVDYKLQSRQVGSNTFQLEQREDGSYLGGTTSRIVDGQRQYGRYAFKGNPQGQYGLFKGGLVGDPKQQGFTLRDSDTRHIKSRDRRPGARNNDRRTASGPLLNFQAGNTVTAAKREGTSEFIKSGGARSGAGLAVATG